MRVKKWLKYLCKCYMHIYIVTVTIMYKYIILYSLMWVFFWQKHVKNVIFSILQNFPTNVVALKTVQNEQWCDGQNRPKGFNPTKQKSFYLVF